MPPPRGQSRDGMAFSARCTFLPSPFLGYAIHLMPGLGDQPGQSFLGISLLTHLWEANRLKRLLNVFPTVGRAACRSRDAGQPQQPQAGKSTARSDRQTPVRAGSAAGAKLTSLINPALYRGYVRKRVGSRKSWLPATKVTRKVTMSRGQTHQGTHPGLTMGYSAETPRDGEAEKDLCPHPCQNTQWAPVWVRTPPPHSPLDRPGR